MKKIDLMIECQSCDGTGVYQGMGERGGAAVICHTCKGTGRQHYVFQYNDFKERKKKPGVIRVYKSDYGYCIKPEPLTLSNGVFVDFAKEGVSYKEFLEGKMPGHIKNMACPMLADQCACHDIKGFVDECQRLNRGWITLISECKCADKMKCWERFEYFGITHQEEERE